MLRLIFIIIGVAILVGIVMSGAFVFDAYLARPEKGAQSVIFTIEEGASAYDIAHRLKDEGIITSPFFFKMYTRLSHSVLQAGSFELMPGASLREIVSELSNAKAQEVQITIPEGYTVKQIGEVVRAALPEISEDEWNEVTGPDGKWLLADSDILLGIPDGQGLQGYLFPDTYRFRIDADAATVAEMMFLTLLRRLSENSIEIPRNLIFEGGLTFHEMLTFASIVEREVQDPEDMKRVAGIFYTRLKIGMALQADSTVNYVTGKQDTSISLEDSRIDSPYNTYQNLGLPPGPISNPGMSAILAVLNPIESDDLYFLTTPEGQVIYAKTFDEHIANKRTYIP